jgi:hypothetical protein
VSDRIPAPGGFVRYIENAQKRFGVSADEAAARLAASRARGGRKRGVMWSTAARQRRRLKAKGKA